MFLDGLMEELKAVFPDKYFHLGGDEVPFGCWYVPLCAANDDLRVDLSRPFD